MNSDKLKGKVAIVTGSSQGIGKAIAAELAQKGIKVMLNGRNKERLEATRTELTKNGYNVSS